jgi:hypothetical protein
VSGSWTKCSATYIPLLGAVLAFGNVVDALAMASEEENFELFSVVGVQASNVGVKTPPLTVSLFYSGVFIVVFLDESEV